MRHLAAYLLLQIGGNASPSAEDIKGVLGAVGIEADEDRLSKLISEIEGKDINTLIAEGSAKFASVRLSPIYSSKHVLMMICFALGPIWRCGVVVFWWCCSFWWCCRS